MGTRCPACSASLHEECYGTLAEGLSGIAGDECCCSAAAEAIHISSSGFTGDDGGSPESPLDFQARLSAHYADDSDVGEKEAWQKDDLSVRDIESTGRKRAVRLFPITDGMVCEWAGLKNAGGGVKPLVGCRGNKLSASKEVREVSGFKSAAVHHGPDKDTLNNNPGNVHRICQFCHNRWHTLNDEYYPDKRPDTGPFIPLNGELIPHDPDTQAEETDYFVTDAYWNMPKKKRLLTDYRMGLV